MMDRSVHLWAALETHCRSWAMVAYRVVYAACICDMVRNQLTCILQSTALHVPGRFGQIQLLMCMQ